MSNLAVKYRPKTLGEIVGQQAIVRTLSNAMTNNNLHHAYLFVGVFGSGKTTAARIVAAMENCEVSPGLNPCGKCRICQSVFEGTHADVVEIDAASGAGKADQIRDLKQEAMYNPIDGCKTKVYILDECLGKNSRVETDQGLIHIHTIVSKRMPIKVKSYNESTGCVEFKPIVGWFKNSGKMVYKIGFETGGRLYACDNHAVYTPNGERLVANLNLGDQVFRRRSALSPLQEQLIYGSLLGDMSITRNEIIGKIRNLVTNARLSVRHSQKQGAYVDHKAQILAPLLKTNPKTTKNGGWGEEVRGFTTITDPSISDVWKVVVKSGRKTVSMEWLNKVDYPGIAYWFCDDGSCARHVCKDGSVTYSISFATHGFTLEEHLILKEWLKIKGIDAKISTDNKGRGSGYYLYLNNVNATKLLHRICWFVPECMGYKLRGFEGMLSRSGFSELPFISNEMKETIAIEAITVKEPCGHESMTYDIEVEDNHNYFVSGTLVHNCHRMSDTACDALLKILEEPPPRVRFILCTTDPQRVRPAVISRCQRHDFRQIYWTQIAERIKYVAACEKVKIDEEAANLCAKMARGSMRSGLQALQKLLDYAGNGHITGQVASEMFGDISEDLYYSLIDQMIGLKEEKDTRNGLRIINEMLQKGVDFATLYLGIAEHIRQLFVAMTATGASEFIQVSSEGKTRLKIQITHCKQNQKLNAVMQSLKCLNDAKLAVEYNLSPEIALQQWFVESVVAFRR